MTTTAHRRRHRHDYLVYSALFALTALVGFSPFALSHKSFIWTTGIDGFNQHYLALMYEGLWLRRIGASILAGHPAIPLWDISIGYGSDIITTLCYYVLGDPLNLLSALVPSRHTEQLFCALVIVRFWLAGLSFCCWCHARRRTAGGVPYAAVAYAFCGFALFAGVRHPFFVNNLIYLPLMFCGVERVYRTGRPGVFVGAVFLAALSNFYFFYMLSIAVAVYAAARYRHYGWQGPAHLARTGLRFLLLGILGFACAGVFVVPSVYALLQSNRAHVPLTHYPLYTFSYYAQLIPSLFATSLGNLGPWRCLGFSGPVLVGLASALATPRTRRATTLGLLMFTLLLCVPAAGSVLNGFSYVSNRWSFYIAPFVCWLLVDQWEQLFDGSLREHTGALALICAVLLAGFAVASVFSLSSRATLLSFALFLLTLFALFAHPQPANARRGPRTTSARIVGALVCAGAAVNALLIYAPNADNYVNDFIEAGCAHDAATATPYVSVRDLAAQDPHTDEPFARAELNTMGRNNLSVGGQVIQPGEIRLDNTSMLTGVSATQYYWSLSNPHVSQFLIDLQLRDFLTQLYPGLDERGIPLALTATRYLWQNPSGGPKALPFGYTQTAQDATIYASDLALPFGYTFDRYLSTDAYERLSAVERPEAMLQAAVVEADDEALLPAAVKPATPTLSSFEVPYALTCEGNVTQVDEHSYLAAAGSKVRLDFTGAANCETYLQLSGVSAQPKSKLDLLRSPHNPLANESYEQYSPSSLMQLRLRELLDPSQDSGLWSFAASTDDTWLSIAYRTAYGAWTDGVNDFCVNLGYRTEPLDHITLTFSDQGLFSFDRISVVCQPFEQVEELVAQRRTAHLEDCWQDTNRFGGTITVPESRILALAIPYEKGWQVQVDGRDVPTMPVNRMFLGTVIGPGTHEVTLRYRTAYLLEGLGVSAVALACAALVCLRPRRRRPQPAGRAPSGARHTPSHGHVESSTMQSLSRYHAQNTRTRTTHRPF